MSNEVILVGRISSEFTNDHSLYGEKYYRVTLSVKRTSGIEDNIPVIVSERLINLREYPVNSYVAVKGQYRSHTLHDKEKNRNKLLLFVFATELEEVKVDNVNNIFLEGVINKPPTHRVTPLGREISDVILLVPREYGKTDRIPCVVWGRAANYVSYLSVGSKLRVAGRVQSREYEKAGEIKTAYEVSVHLAECI